MKIFHCDQCRHLIFFDNTECVHCGHVLAYLPDVAQMASLVPAGDGLWRSGLVDTHGHPYRRCANYEQHQVCNWAVVASDARALCISCRLTRVIPDLAVPGHRDVWHRLELAKRRVVYTLLALGLPLANKQDDPVAGLAFDFLTDSSAPGWSPFLTGHVDGVITINAAEADDAERERRKAQLHEPARTLLGHFRHESGHYYWDRLIRDRGEQAAFRARFGDERQDYGRAICRFYEHGPLASWDERFLSCYAGVHPWEDWAETWGHYLQIVDALETAAACGMSIRPDEAGEPPLRVPADETGTPIAPFDRLIASWFPLAYVLNNLNRGLGLPDAYPFALSTAAVEKLRFVHETIAAASGSRLG